MPNVANPEAARAVAHKASTRIPHAAMARRFEKLAFKILLADARNLRPAAACDEPTLPEWTRGARQRGETIHIFALNRGAGQRVRIAAQRLADVCAIAAADPHPRLKAGASICAARGFIQKYDRMNFETANRKAYAYSRLRRRWLDENDDDQLCPDQTIEATRGRVWKRITSLGKLRAAGCEFRNCLAHTSQRSGYGGALARGAGQFWVLRTADGAGLAIAFAAWPSPTHIREVKGPRNALLSADNPDLLALAAALGIKPRDPPTPPPPEPPPASLAALQLLMGENDRQHSARVRLLRELSAPLRQRDRGH